MKDRHFFFVMVTCALFSLASCASTNVSQKAPGKLDGPQTAIDGRGLVELWASDTPAFGLFVSGPRAQSAAGEKPASLTVQAGRELAANPLLDFTFLNLEGYYDFESAQNVHEGLHSGRADSANALLVRIPPMSEADVEVSRARVKELLELGVDGVVFPHVQNAEEARMAVSFFEGVNVWSPTNPDGDFVVMLLLEEPDVFAELEEIANIPGYSALVSGIGSLTSVMGGDREAAEKLSLELLAQSQRAGLADLITADTESIALRVNQGFLALVVSGPTADEAIRLGRAAAGR